MELCDLQTEKVTGRIPKRSWHPSQRKSPAQRQGELLSRLRRLEAVVTELTAQVEDGSASSVGQVLQNRLVPASEQTRAHKSSGEGSQLLPGPSLNASTTNGNEFDEDFGNLVVQKAEGLHIGKQFWSVFCTEVDHILQAVHDVTSYAETTDSTESDIASQMIPHDQSFAFPNAFASDKIDKLGLLIPQMPLLWNIFVHRVDPFIKILDLSTLGSFVQSLDGTFSTVGPAMEALLFSISLAAVISLDEAEVVQEFTAEKTFLLASYRSATEQALGKASFLTSKELPAVQALVIYLSVLPYLDENELAWSLTGALLRIAKSMRLLSADPIRNGGSHELGERLKWHIHFIDSRSQSYKLQSLSTPGSRREFPKSEFALESKITLPPASSINESSAIIHFIRCHLWQITRQLIQTSQKDTPPELRCIQEARADLEKTCGSLLYRGTPLGQFAWTMADLFFANIRVGIQTAKERETALAGDEFTADLNHLETSITAVNAVYALKTEAAWAEWQWQLEGSLPWAALRAIILEGRTDPGKQELFQPCMRAKHLLASASELTRKHGMWEKLMLLAIDVTNSMDQLQHNNYQPVRLDQEETASHLGSSEVGNSRAAASLNSTIETEENAAFDAHRLNIEEPMSWDILYDFQAAWGI
ncbi:Aurofusarin cluster transcription factor aurR2 [Paramyrothecium foliicola]|nr:Aurofusarin cluster transcription factor aurR2 [Paramyrothecium foliicola]